MTTESALQRIAKAEAELAAAKAELAAKEKLKPWRPGGTGCWWTASGNGEPYEYPWGVPSPTIEKQGNIWRTKEQAQSVARLHAIINHSMAFAYAAGGDGTRKTGDYSLDSYDGWRVVDASGADDDCGLVEPFDGGYCPATVWFPTRESAQACMDFLQERGLL